LVLLPVVVLAVDRDRDLQKKDIGWIYLGEDFHPADPSPVPRVARKQSSIENGPSNAARETKPLRQRVQQAWRKRTRKRMGWPQNCYQFDNVGDGVVVLVVLKNDYFES